MSSGVPVNPECVAAFQELKLGKKLKFIIFKLNDKNDDIIVDQTSSGDYEEFLGVLPADQPRWAVYDFEFEKEDGGKRNKITFISWSPDEAKIKQKMVYASSRDALRRSLQGVALEIQATDYEEVSHDAVLDKANKGS